MGLFSFLLDDDKKKDNDDLIDVEGKALGLTKEEIEECKRDKITPQEWLKENDIENYHDQDLDD